MIHDNTANFGFLLSLVIISGYGTQTIDLPGYNPWIIPSSNRTDMYCPVGCLSGTSGADSLEYEECCACDARPCWEINSTLCGITVEYLQLEYYTVYGEAMVIDNTSIQADIRVLVHISGRLSSLPNSLCDYNNTLEYVDLSKNYLTNIDSIACLIQLDTLRLDNNLIETVSNSTFSHMVQLRVLSMRNNRIGVLHPNTIKIASSNILFVDFSNNYLNQTDITNILQAGTFCERRFDGCDLGDVTNMNDYVMYPALHGPGDLYLNGSNIGQLIDFTTVGVTDYRELQKTQMSVNVDASSIYCDCNIYQLFHGLESSVFKFWPNLADDINKCICENPEKMRGVNLREYFEGGNYTDLTCGLVENCTDGCVCEDRSSEEIVVVDCSNRTLNTLPELVPRGKFAEKDIVLILDGNSIASIDDTYYLSRIIELRMVNNAVRGISKNAIFHLTRARIDIRDQEIDYLDREFQLLNPNTVIFGDNPVICDCTNIWIGDWIRRHEVKEILYCNVNGNKIAAELVTAENLNCSTESAQIFRNIAVAAAVFLTLCVVFGIFHHFRLELFLWKRRLFLAALNRRPVVFLSICTDNDATYQYVRYYVQPCLKANNVPWILPLMHATPGENIEDYISDATDKSDIFVIFLCEQYQDEDQSMQEFDIIWKKFKSNTQKQILVVIWAGFDIADIRDKRMKALCKSGSCLDFGETDSKLLDRLMRKLLPNKDFTTVEDYRGPGFDISHNAQRDINDGPVNSRYRHRTPKLPNSREISDKGSIYTITPNLASSHRPVYCRRNIDF